MFKLLRFLVVLLFTTHALAQSGVVLSGAGLGGGGGVPLGDAPTAVTTASSTTCFAPCPVHFDGRESTDPNIATRTLRLKRLAHTWDFADPGAGDWATGNQRGSKNVDIGFVAGHVYETAGTYVWRHTVNDATGLRDSDTGTVTVTAQDATFPTTQTICVPDTGADFTGCPAGATHASASSDFDVIWNTTCNLDATATATRCLLKRGGSYISSTGVSRSTLAHTVLDAYGSGAKPIITINPGGHQIFFQSTANSFRGIVANIRAVGTDAVSDGVHAQPSSATSNNLWMRIDAEDMESPFNNYGGGASFDPDTPSTMSRYNTWYETTTLSSCDEQCSNGANESFLEGEFTLFLGNRWGDKEGDEHVVRSGWTLAGVVSHSDLGNNLRTLAGCGTIRLIIKIHNNKESQTSSNNREFVIADNLLTACDANDASVNIGVRDGGDATSASVDWAFLNNRLRNLDNATGITGITAHTGPGVIAGNIFEMTEPTGAGTIRGIALQRFGAVQLLDPDDIDVFDNSFHMNNSGRSGTAITVSSDATGATVKNNLGHQQAGTLTGISDSGVGTTTCASCNLFTATNPYSVLGPDTHSEFALSASSAAKDIGELWAVPNGNFTGVNKPEQFETNLDAGAWQRSNTPLSVGFNASRTGPDRTNISFADLMKNSGGSSAGAWTLHDAGTPTYDANGYPVSVVSGTNRVRLSLVDPPDADYPSGTYSLQITGTSSIVLTGDATGTYSAGTSAVTVTPSATGITLRVESGSPTNIKFIQPGYTTETFTTNYLNKLRGSGAIRFMAWSRINFGAGTPECDDWADRRLTTSVTQAGFCGPAPEYMIELANALDTDLWIVVPHAYTDSAIASLAALVNANLESARQVYLEYSNENWNGSFDQGDEECADGDALWSDLDGAIDCVAVHGLEERTYKARYAAKRTAAIGDAFRAEFADDSRLRIVLAIQSGQSGAGHFNELLLSAFSQSSIAGVSVNPNSLQPYIYAGAPYFGGNLCADMSTAGTLATATAADVVTELYRTYLANAVTRVTTDVAVAQAYNASKGWSMLVGQYEGGTANEDTGETGCNAVAFSSQRAAGMRDLMRRYVRDIFDIEGALRGVYLHYNSPESYGDVDGILSHVYGLIESSQDDETTVPKWQGWQDVVR